MPRQAAAPLPIGDTRYGAVLLAAPLVTLLLRPRGRVCQLCVVSELSRAAVGGESCLAVVEVRERLSSLGSVSVRVCSGAAVCGAGGSSAPSPPSHHPNTSRTAPPSARLPFAPPGSARLLGTCGRDARASGSSSGCWSWAPQITRPFRALLTENLSRRGALAQDPARCFV